jgi:hypothetical protein
VTEQDRRHVLNARDFLDAEADLQEQLRVDGRQRHPVKFHAALEQHHLSRFVAADIIVEDLLQPLAVRFVQDLTGLEEAGRRQARAKHAS